MKTLNELLGSGKSIHAVDVVVNRQIVSTIVNPVVNIRSGIVYFTDPNGESVIKAPASSVSDVSRIASMMITPLSDSTNVITYYRK